MFHPKIFPGRWEKFPENEWGRFKAGRAKRKRAMDEIRHHIHLAGAAEAADEYILELLQDGPAKMTPKQARAYVANLTRRDLLA